MPNWASLVRLLRRRLVLGIIFALSLTYCAISLLSHEKLGDSLRRIRVRDDPDGNMFGDNHDSPIVDYNENGDEEIFKGSANGGGDWQMENNYETENDDPIDNTRANLDSNDTIVIARTCRNSVQGKALIVDERGFVCSRSELLSTGCCSSTALKKVKDESADEAAPSSSKRKRYSCDTCNPQGCCAIYEYCVSCCLQPGKRRGKKNMGERERRDSLKGRARDEDMIRPRLRNLDRFQICLTTCRTSSASVRHENTYKDPISKHCYSQYQRHRRDDSLLKNNNGDNSIVVVTPSSTSQLFIRQQFLYPILSTDMEISILSFLILVRRIEMN